jgi:hypothetical protein
VNGTRILLARRTSGSDHALVLEPDGFRVEGGFTPRRRVAYRSVYGLERAGAWLWVGAGLAPVIVGGGAAPAASLDAAAAALRARIAALPDGAARLARMDARRPSRARLPWLAPALTAVLGGVLAAAGALSLSAAAGLLFGLALALLAERWLGAWPLLASGGAALLAASLAERPASLAGFATLAAPALAAGWLGLLARARLLLERSLAVRERSAFDLAAPLGLGFLLSALAAGASPFVLILELGAGLGAGLLVLRRAAA